MRAWCESQPLLRWSLELASRGAAGSGTVQNVDDHSHRCPSKLRHKLFHSLYKCGRDEFVGLFREETEPTHVCLPLGERHFLILAPLGRSSSQMFPYAGYRDGGRGTIAFGVTFPHRIDGVWPTVLRL